MAKIELLKSLQAKLTLLKQTQKEIVAIETQLKEIDPSTTISSFGASQSTDASPELVEFTREFFNAKKAIEEIAKAEFKEYSVPASIGQAVGFWMAHTNQKAE